MDEHFLTENAPDGGLFQSDAWARFQDMSGNKSVPFEGRGCSGFAFRHTLPVFGDYLYIPRGPVLQTGTADEESVAETLAALAKKEHAGWVRTEPQTEEALALLKKGFAHQIAPAPHDMQPRETFALALDGEEENWLARMKPKTRYNVRLAEKRGVRVRFSRDPKDMENFLALIKATAHRQQIRLHPDEYYRNFFRAFPAEKCVLALAEHEGSALASALLLFFGHTTYYLHGGSSDLKRELMGPFLLHFEAMREAKRRGTTFYDLGGVKVHTKKDDDDRDWEGITRFKLNFAPNQETIVFPGTYDIIFNPQRYFLYTKGRLIKGSLDLLRKMRNA